MLLIGKLLTLVLHVSSCFGFYTPYQASKTLLSGRKSECSLTVLFGNTVLSNSIQVSSAAATSNEKPPINERKHPHFPGAVPINATDIQTLIHQTNQASPASAIIGKPATCQCIHGYTQAFSLDPIPMAGNRLNSGLLKLTCPLLVNAIDALEDDGFIAKINEKLQNDDALTTFINEAHAVHSKSRKDLLSADTDELDSSDITPPAIIERKLGKQRVEYFMEAGVAGANPKAKTPDVKCLHAWFGDYIFRANDASTKSHLIGILIKDALAERGIDMNGTENCHLICSGTRSSVSSQSGQRVSVPTPRNKQRKRSVKGTERRRRIRQEQRLLGNKNYLSN